MKDADSRELYEVVRAVYHSHCDRPTLNPAWLATEAMHAIGFARNLNEIGYLGCHLQFRQIARSFCRKHFEPAQSDEPDLFPGTLQQRYPRRPENEDEEPVYVLLDLLDDDVAYNVMRLRKEARAKLAHADALEAWGKRRAGAA
ncbi:MAG: hypothetical protein ACJ8AI_10245 [Rhodopila sp.]|jgi:hypothetical protein